MMKPLPLNFLSYFGNMALASHYQQPYEAEESVGGPFEVHIIANLSEKETR